MWAHNNTTAKLAVSAQEKYNWFSCWLWAANVVIHQALSHWWNLSGWNMQALERPLAKLNSPAPVLIFTAWNYCFCSTNKQMFTLFIKSEMATSRRFQPFFTIASNFCSWNQSFKHGLIFKCSFSLCKIHENYDTIRHILYKICHNEELLDKGEFILWH